MTDLDLEAYEIPELDLLLFFDLDDFDLDDYESTEFSDEEYELDLLYLFEFFFLSLSLCLYFPLLELLL